MAGVNIVAIGYKDSQRQPQRLMSGEVHLSITDSGVLAPHVASGKMRALAVTAPSRRASSWVTHGGGHGTAWL